MIYVPTQYKRQIRGTPIAVVNSKNFLKESRRLLREYGNISQYIYCDFEIYKVSKEEYERLGGRIL